MQTEKNTSVRPKLSESMFTYAFLQDMDPDLLSIQIGRWKQRLPNITHGKARARINGMIEAMETILAIAATNKPGAAQNQQSSPTNKPEPVKKAARTKISAVNLPDIPLNILISLKQHLRKWMHKSIAEATKGNTPLVEPMMVETDIGSFIFIMTRRTEDESPDQEIDDTVMFYSAAVEDATLGKDCQDKSPYVVTQNNEAMNCYIPASFGKLNGFVVHATPGLSLRFWKSADRGSGMETFCQRRAIVQNHPEDGGLYLQFLQDGEE